MSTLVLPMSSPKSLKRTFDDVEDIENRQPNATDIPPQSPLSNVHSAQPLPEMNIAPSNVPPNPPKKPKLTFAEREAEKEAKKIEKEAKEREKAEERAKKEEEKQRKEQEKAAREAEREKKALEKKAKDEELRKAREEREKVKEEQKAKREEEKTKRDEEKAKKEEEKHKKDRVRWGMERLSNPTDRCSLNYDSMHSSDNPSQEVRQTHPSQHHLPAGEALLLRRSVLPSRERNLRLRHLRTHDTQILNDSSHHSLSTQM